MNISPFLQIYDIFQSLVQILAGRPKLICRALRNEQVLQLCVENAVEVVFEDVIVDDEKNLGVVKVEDLAFLLAELAPLPATGNRVSLVHFEHCLKQSALGCQAHGAFDFFLSLGVLD